MSNPFKMIMLGTVALIVIAVAIATNHTHRLLTKPAPTFGTQNVSLDQQIKVVAKPVIGRVGDDRGNFRNDSNQWVDRLTAWSAETDCATRNQMMQAMLNLLTSSNATEIVKSLPPEFLDTPLGVAGLGYWAASDRITAAGWLAGQTNVSLAETVAVVHDWWSSDQAEF